MVAKEILVKKYVVRLSAEERDYLEAELAIEARAKGTHGPSSVWNALRLRNVWLLALGIFATNTGGYALAFWLPTTTRSTPQARVSRRIAPAPEMASTTTDPSRLQALQVLLGGCGTDSR